MYYIKYGGVNFVIRFYGVIGFGRRDNGVVIVEGFDGYDG